MKSIFVDRVNNVIIAGTFTDPANLFDEAFIVKLQGSNNGVLLDETRLGGGTTFINVAGAVSPPDDDVYVVGDTDLNPMTSGSTSTQSDGGGDVFVLQLTLALTPINA